MRFQVAVAAVLAAENLSSSGVSAGGSLTEERAKLRNEAIEAAKKKFPHEIRRGLQERRPYRKLVQDQVLRNKDLRKVRSAAQKHRRRLQKKMSNSKSEDLDLGVLGAKTATKEERREKLLSSVEKLRSKKETLLNLNKRSGSSGSQSIIPDLGILKNKDETQKLFNALNPDNRRLQVDFDPEKLAANPLTYMVTNQLCIAGYNYNCGTCDLVYNTEGLPADGYSFTLECDIQEGTYTYIVFQQVRDNFDKLCNMGFCEGGCDIDSDGIKIQMNDCASANLGGDIDTLPELLPDGSDGDLTDLADLADLVGGDSLGGMLGMLGNNPLASMFSQICTGLEAYEAASGEQVCTTCKITYLDEIGDIKPYDIVMDCPNVPENLAEGEDSGGFEDVGNVCSYGFCDSCEVDEDASKFELKNCSVAFFSDNVEGVIEDAVEDALAELDDDFLNNPISDPIIDTITDMIIEDGEIDSNPVLSTKIAMTKYFAEICDPKCEKCGLTSEDTADSFSFEFDCPAKLSSADAKFGAYVDIAATLCAAESLLSLNCSTCEVDPFDSTINIKDCRAITSIEEDLDTDPNDFGYTNDDYVGTKIRPTDAQIFQNRYTYYCKTPPLLDTDYGEELLNYELLNYEKGVKCDCTFDREAKNASFSCEFYQGCRQFDSYCGPITMCYDSVKGSSVSVSFTQNKPLSFQKCFSTSFGGGSDDYNFKYCLDLLLPDDAGNENEPKSVDCELEVQGIQCNSCSVNTSIAEYYGISPSSVLVGLNSPISYDCTNTVIGKSGNRTNPYENPLIEDTLAYYTYRSLPCSGGCDLCGDEEGQFMSKPDGEFSTEIWKDNKIDTCFAAQLEAMTLVQSLTDKECQDMKDVVREPCGCKNINPPQSNPPQSGAHSLFGKSFFTTGSIGLTIAAASVLQMLLG